MFFKNDSQRRAVFSKLALGNVHNQSGCDQFRNMNKFARNESAISPESFQLRNLHIPYEEIERAYEKANEEIKWDLAGSVDINSIPVVLAPFGYPANSVAVSLQKMTPVGNWFYDQGEIAHTFNKPYRDLEKKWQPEKRRRQREELLLKAAEYQANIAKKRAFEQAERKEKAYADLSEDIMNGRRSGYPHVNISPDEERTGDD